MQHLCCVSAVLVPGIAADIVLQLVPAHHLLAQSSSYYLEPGCSRWELQTIQ